MSPQNVEPTHWSQIYDDPETEYRRASVTVGIHWLRYQTHRAHMEALSAWLDAVWGANEARAYGLWTYDRSRRWSNGATLNYQSDHFRDRITNGWVTLEIPGGVLAQYDMCDVAEFCKRLAEDFPGRCGRIDAFVDDYERVITPRELFDLVYAEDYSVDPVPVKVGRKTVLHRPVLKRDFTQFRTIKYSTESNTTHGCQYDQVRFGHRGDEKGKGLSLSFYDKWLESGGAIPALRIEAEVTGRRAEQLFSRLCLTATQEWVQCIASLIATAIDFPIRGELSRKCQHLDRLARHAFWTNLVERLGDKDSTLLALAVKPQTVTRSLGFVERQAIPSMQCLKLALGRKAFLTWLIGEIEGEDRLNKRHRDALAEYRRKLSTDKSDPEILGMMDWFAERGLEFDPDVGDGE